MRCSRRQAVPMVLTASAVVGTRSAASAAASAAQPVAQPATLPAPTGPYPVGRAVYAWTDPTRAELYAEAPGASRELLVWIWYPAAPESGAEAGEYAPAGWEATGEFWGFDAGDVRGHAIPEAPVAPDEARYPVVLFSGNGFPAFNHTALLEDLASHGYVVVGVSHPYQMPVTIFPDGRTVPMAPVFAESFFGPFTAPVDEVLRGRETIVDYKVADLQSVLRQLERLDDSEDPLAGRLDLSRLSALGHSMGGNAALELCRVDRRCRAAVNLDGANWTEVGRTGLTQPAMLITVAREHEPPCQDSPAYPAALCEADRAVGEAGWRVVAETGQPSYTVTVAGATHMSFLDLPFLAATPGGMIEAGGQAATIDPTRMWRITGDYLLAFFDQYLNGVPAPLLTGPAADLPEVSFATNRH